MTGRLVAVDPGLRAAGVALFEDGALTRGWVVYEDYGEEAWQWRAMAEAISSTIRALGEVDTLVVERMEPRQGRRDAWSDIIGLAHIAGGIITATVDIVHRPVAVRPSLWTGKRPKHVNHAELRTLLDEDETAALEAAENACLRSNRKEVLDAVGMGLYELGRWR